VAKLGFLHLGFLGFNKKPDFLKRPAIGFYWVLIECGIISSVLLAFLKVRE
jgi:hypothetical protein